MNTNTYYYTVKINDDDADRTYHGFTLAANYQDAMSYLMDNLFDDSQCIESITLREFYETDIMVSESTAKRIIADLNSYPVCEEEKN